MRRRPIRRLNIPGFYVIHVSEHYNTLTSHRSPSSVADAIEHIAERIMVKAAEQATRVVDREANRTRK